MKNPPNKLICDAVMYHIAKVSAESANPSGKHFGRKVLRDTIKMWLDDFTQLEFNVAIQWLLDNSYLKTLGQHSVGTGTGKDIKQYDLNGYTPYKQISPEQLDTEWHPAAHKATKSTALDNNISVADGENNKPPPKREPLKVVSGSSAVTDDERKEINRVIQAEPPAFMLKEINEFQPIEQSLNTLKARLNGKPVENLTIKLRTLDGLARLLDPEISDVLNQIHEDLKEITQ
jgi:hypothetical protein